MPLFSRKTRRDGVKPPAPRPAQGGKQSANESPPNTTDMDVSREDRGYDPYDVSPREKAKRGKTDKWSF